jgi:hypothetical protein
VNGLTCFPRLEFVERRWRYRRGNHVTIIGPPGSGKTVLGFHLLEHTASRDMPAVMLVKKPTDIEISAWGKHLRYRKVPTWPPPPSWWSWLPGADSDPPGWLVWPRTRFDPDLDRPHKHDVFRRALMHAYRGGGVFKKRPRIVVTDDAYGLSEILKLREYLIENWTEARSMGCGQWAYFQRPSHVPLWAYQADHLFLFNEPDKRSRIRFGEIGGIDADMVQETVMQLDQYQALYIRRAGRRVCIVDR